jgi:hypothetical protein
MKYIVKGDEPEELQAWKAQENEDWQPTYADFVTGYLEKDDRGKFGEFWSTINYLFVR